MDAYCASLSYLMVLRVFMWTQPGCNKAFLGSWGSFMTVMWQGWKSKKNGKFCKHLNIVAPSQVKEKKKSNECTDTRKMCNFREKNCIWYLGRIFFVWTLSALVLAGFPHSFPGHLISFSLCGWWSPWVGEVCVFRHPCPCHLHSQVTTVVI